MLVSGQGPSTGSGAWSQWQPSTTSLGDGAQQIADHVAPTYRQQGGDQLVGVTGGPLKVAASPDPLPAKIAVASQDTTKIGIIRGTTAMYSLCGLGSRCSINRGKPSTQRFLLLRREALELALYSFRYLDVANVVALLPPAPGQRPQNAVFFQRSEFKKVLDHPIDQVLPSPPPSIVRPHRYTPGQADQHGDGTERLLLLLPAGPGPQRVPRAPEAGREREAALRGGADDGIGDAPADHVRLERDDEQRLTLARPPRWRAPRRAWTGSTSTPGRSTCGGCACSCCPGCSACRGSAASTATRPGR